MNALILLGAGFSHNWGGRLAREVFDHLIGVPDIRRFERLIRLLWQHNSGGGFEDAIAEVQRDYRLDPDRHAALTEHAGCTGGESGIAAPILGAGPAGPTLRVGQNCSRQFCRTPWSMVRGFESPSRSGNTEGDWRARLLNPIGGESGIRTHEHP